VGLRKKVGHVQSEKATAVAGVIMIVFLFLGESILKLLGVDVQSFAIAGSFIIFFLALEMILGITLYKEESPSTASIVPIAFPLIAGAGTMTSLVSLQAEFAMINIIIAIVLNMIVVYAVLKNTERLERILGPGGLSVLRKVFGIILLAIAVKLFFTNLIPLLQQV
jgi:multiple antibiotic resistance protein